MISRGDTWIAASGRVALGIDLPTCFVVANSRLLVQRVELQQFIVGWLVAQVLYLLSSSFKFRLQNLKEFRRSSVSQPNTKEILNKSTS